MCWDEERNAISVLDVLRSEQREPVADLL